MRILFALMTILSSLLVSVASTAKPVPVEHYSRPIAYYDAAISPDGNILGVVVEESGQYVVRIIDLATNKASDTGLGKGLAPKWIIWGNNDILLVSIGKVGKIGRKNANFGFLYAVPKNLSQPYFLISPRGPTTNLDYINYYQYYDRVVDFLVDDPDHILMAFGEIDAHEPGIFKVNIRTRAMKTVRGGSKHFQNWITDLRGEPRVGQGRQESNNDGSLIIRGANNNKWESYKHYTGLTASTPIFGFMENPNEMVVGSYAGKDTLGIYVYDLVQKKRVRKLFHNDIYDVSSLILSPDRKKAIGATYTAETEEKYFFDKVYQAKWNSIKSKLDGLTARVIDQSRDGKLAVVRVTGPSTPSSMQIYYADTGTFKLVGHDYPEMGDTIQGDLVTTRYTARDGTKIPTYVTLPTKIADGMPLKNLPFIIMPHGGPYARDTKSFDFLAQFMASRGYGVLQMDYRGSEGYGRAYEAAGRKNWVVMQEDVEDGTKWLVKKGYADPERICIVGWSYGGYAALMGAIKNPDLYTCSVSIAGLTDPIGMAIYLKTFTGGRHTAKNFILNGFNTTQDIKDNSPVERGRDIQIPVFLAHGTKDIVVEFRQFKRMKSALKKSKGKHTYLELKGGTHNLSSMEHRTKLLKGLDIFLADNLGESAAAP